MATLTPNLSLIKPADTDSADIADINDNMTILDTKIGPVGNTSLQAQLGTASMGTTATTVTGAIAEHEGDISTLTSGLSSANTAIAKRNTISYEVETLSALNTTLNTLINSLNDGETRFLKFLLGNASGPFSASTWYEGWLFRNTTNYGACNVLHHNVVSVIGACNNGSWTWEKLALNSSVANVQNGLAYIVGNTNTTGSTLADGQFVYVKGHSTIAEGLRKVTASISANGSITTNNTTAVSGGGLNELNSNKLNFYEATFPNITLENGTQTIQLTQDASGFPDVVAKSIIFTSALYNVYYQWASQSSTNKINVTTTWYINAKNERGSQISGVTIKALVLY